VPSGSGGNSGIAKSSERAFPPHFDQIEGDRRFVRSKGQQKVERVVPLMPSYDYRVACALGCRPNLIYKVC
jgi:hypothetical protein